MTVKDGNRILVENTDYTLVYADNVNVGTATVTIIGKSNYTDRISKEFTIRKKSVNNLVVSLDESEFVYDGESHSPSVTVKYGNITLKKGVDYEVSYENNINAGAATVTVTGKGNYDGEQSRKYSILSKTIEGVAITVEPNMLDYDGTEKQPAVKVYDGDTLLTVNVDYTVSYENNVEAGEGKVIINGLGNYDESAEATFEIHYMLGDVNGDGAINITDATMVQKAVAELITLTDEQRRAADTDGDGAITISDATQIQKYVAEIIDHF